MSGEILVGTMTQKRGISVQTMLPQCILQSSVQCCAQIMPPQCMTQSSVQCCADVQVLVLVVLWIKY